MTVTLEEGATDTIGAELRNDVVALIYGVKPELWELTNTDLSNLLDKPPQEIAEFAQAKLILWQAKKLVGTELGLVFNLGGEGWADLITWAEGIINE